MDTRATNWTKGREGRDLCALYQAQPGIRQQMIVSAYTAGDISLGKAAELMGVSHEEMKEFLVESTETAEVLKTSEVAACAGYAFASRLLLRYHVLVG